jgi:hypothetical protein
MTQYREVQLASAYREYLGNTLPPPAPAQSDIAPPVTLAQLQISRVVLKSMQDAQLVLKQLNAGTSFQSVIAAHGGGKLSPKLYAQLHPAEQSVLLSLKDGEISKIIPRNKTFTIYHRDGTLPATKNASPSSPENAAQARQAQIFAALREQVVNARPGLKIEIRKEALDAIIPIKPESSGNRP